MQAGQRLRVGHVVAQQARHLPLVGGHSGGHRLLKLAAGSQGQARSDGASPSPAPEDASLLEQLAAEGGEVVPVCAKIEAELSELDETDRRELLESVGLEEPALAVLARAVYRLLGLQSYFTAGEKEIRAWTIPIGATAPQGAGVIHSDFERGFIRAEVFSLEHLRQFESEKAIREAGKLRVEGKAYVMQDGDICHFLFNV
jgi:ribosome-binding ATPase YchF (GTP1/OBG family)